MIIIATGEKNILCLEDAIYSYCPHERLNKGEINMNENISVVR